jgi:NADPH-dependent curcumin reductase CurA
VSERNRQLLLAARPHGEIKPTDWEVVEVAAPEPAEGEFAARTRYLSLDPAMRGWLDDKPSYMPPVGLGEVMRASSIVEVTESRNERYAPGDLVLGMFGVQERIVSNGKGALRLEPAGVALPTYLGALGIAGMTAYFGLLDVGAPQPGQTVVVSGAAGAVGSVAGQLARIKGCRVVGIAGGPEKAAVLTGELGFDAAIDYRAQDVEAALREHCPDGIDVYFDNVGGPILDAALANLAEHARVVLCGAISQYNSTTGVIGPANYLALLQRRARMEGVLVIDYFKRFKEATAELAGYIADGRLIAREEVVTGGVEDFPATLARLFRGDNIGKLVLALP